MNFLVKHTLQRRSFPLTQLFDGCFGESQLALYLSDHCITGMAFFNATIRHSCFLLMASRSRGPVSATRCGLEWPHPSRPSHLIVTNVPSEPTVLYRMTVRISCDGRPNSGTSAFHDRYWTQRLAYRSIQPAWRDDPNSWFGTWFELCSAHQRLPKGRRTAWSVARESEERMFWADLVDFSEYRQLTWSRVFPCSWIGRHGWKWPSGRTWPLRSRLVFARATRLPEWRRSNRRSSAAGPICCKTVSTQMKPVPRSSPHACWPIRTVVFKFAANTPIIYCSSLLRWFQAILWFLPIAMRAWFDPWQLHRQFRFAVFPSPAAGNRPRPSWMSRLDVAWFCITTRFIRLLTTTLMWVLEQRILCWIHPYPRLLVRRRCRTISRPMFVRSFITPATTRCFSCYFFLSKNA